MCWKSYLILIKQLNKKKVGKFELYTMIIIIYMLNLLFNFD